MSITDSISHSPPMTGTYHYNNFQPGTPGHPSVGGSYTDPIFGESITRLTARTGVGSAENTYARNGFHNADSTKCFSWGSGASLDIINSSTGDVLKTNQPTGIQSYEVQWSPVDANVYYFIGTGADSTKIMQRNTATDTTSVLRNFTTESGGVALQDLGGTNDWVDNTDRYFVVRWSGVSHVWDRIEDVVYSGTAADFVSNNGWVGISPDGAYLASAEGTAAYPNVQHHSWALNHTTNTIAASPVQWCGLGGDHGDLISASDGKNYCVKFNFDVSPPGLYLWDLTVSMAGKTDVQQVAAAAKVLVQMTDFNDTSGHLSCVSKGANRDWAWWSSENVTDVFDRDPALGWSKYRQEIIACNVVTGEVRRYAHHRSRSNSSYYAQPRVCASWDGSRIIWPSNFNDNGTVDYADLYALTIPTSSICLFL